MRNYVIYQRPDGTLTGLLEESEHYRTKGFVVVPFDVPEPVNDEPTGDEESEADGEAEVADADGADESSDDAPPPPVSVEEVQHSWLSLLRSSSRTGQ